MRMQKVIKGSLLSVGTLLVVSVLTVGFTGTAYSWETTGQLRVIKTDSAGAPLIGAGFTLYTVGKDGNPGVATGWSCLISKVDNGVAACATSDQVTPGSYWVEETTVPAGYSAGAPQKVTIEQMQVTTVTFKDNLLPGSVVITKTDAAGQPVVGAGFTVYADANGAPGASTGKSCQNSAVVDGKATCTIANVAVGTYWVEETTVPNGYIAASPQKVSVSAGQVARVTMVDVPVPASGGTTTTTSPRHCARTGGEHQPSATVRDPWRGSGSRGNDRRPIRSRDVYGMTKATPSPPTRDS